VRPPESVTVSFTVVAPETGRRVRSTGVVPSQEASVLPSLLRSHAYCWTITPAETDRDASKEIGPPFGTLAAESVNCAFAGGVEEGVKFGTGVGMPAGVLPPPPSGGPAPALTMWPLLGITRLPPYAGLFTVTVIGTSPTAVQVCEPETSKPAPGTLTTVPAEE
jgi:hypothetical protein